MLLYFHSDALYGTVVKNKEIYQCILFKVAVTLQYSNLMV